MGIFSADKVHLQFTVSSIVSLVVENNILCFALRTGRIIRIDLDNPQSVDDIDLPKKTSEIGQISAIFLDPSGSYLLITTALGENYCLKYQSTRVKHLSKLKGLKITSVAWSPIEHSRSSGEILLGTEDGNLYETLIEPSDEYFKKEDRYLKQVWSLEGESISSIRAFASHLPSPSDKPVASLYSKESGSSGVPVRRSVILTSSGGKMWIWNGTVSSNHVTGSSPLYPNFFDKEAMVEEYGQAPLAVGPQSFSVSPSGTHYGWLNKLGILHGGVYNEDTKLLLDPSKIIKNARISLYEQFLASSNGSDAQEIQCLLMSEYHIIMIQSPRTILAISRLNNEVMFKKYITEDTTEKLIGLCADEKSHTYWAFSESNIYEIVVDNEESGAWKQLLDIGSYDEALKVASTEAAVDAVCTAYGKSLILNKEYELAAEILAKSSTPLESASLQFINAQQRHALLKYLIARLPRYRKGSIQRSMVGLWTTELFMELLDEEEEKKTVEHDFDTDPKASKSSTDITGANGHISDTNTSTLQNTQLEHQFRKFISANFNDLDTATVFEIISSHGRQSELLYFAETIGDFDYVISYWMRIEKWSEALKVLLVQNDAQLAYKYATSLLVNSPRETVDVWMRLSDLDPSKLIPSIMTFIMSFRNASTENSNPALRYLNYVIKNGSKDSGVHNTVVALYATSNSESEDALLKFLESQGSSPYFDFDFALRVCLQYKRVRCAVHAYSMMGLLEEAVQLSLEYDKIDLAEEIADAADDTLLRKKLWLSIAKLDITKKANNGGSEKGIVESAVSFLSKCDLLKIEDMLDLFPNFSVIDLFKDEITKSMEKCSLTVARLNQEMEDSLATSNNIKQEMKLFDHRYTIIEPGEGCSICGYPLVSRKFVAFPCQHSFHSDCLVLYLKENGDYDTKKKISELQNRPGKITVELEKVITKNCILCGDDRIDMIDKPFQSDSAMWDF